MRAAVRLTLVLGWELCCVTLRNQTQRAADRRRGLTITSPMRTSSCRGRRTSSSVKFAAPTAATTGHENP